MTLTQLANIEVKPEGKPVPAFRAGKVSCKCGALATWQYGTGLEVVFVCEAHKAVA